MHEYIFDSQKKYSYRIYFGRSEDYQSIRNISKRTGKAIKFNEDRNKAILNARLKYYKNELQSQEISNVVTNFTGKNFDFYDYEGEGLNVTFDGYELDLRLNELFNYNERKQSDNIFCVESSDYY